MFDCKTKSQNLKWNNRYLNIMKLYNLLIHHCYKATVTGVVKLGNVGNYKHNTLPPLVLHNWNEWFATISFSWRHNWNGFMEQRLNQNVYCSCRGNITWDLFVPTFFLSKLSHTDAITKRIVIYLMFMLANIAHKFKKKLLCYSLLKWNSFCLQTQLN